MIGHILLTLAALTVNGFLLLVLIGLWDRYEHETGALSFSRIYERYFASQADLAKGEQLTPQQRPKLVGAGAVGGANQGISVALSADGNTAIVGGPGPNNADRDRSPSVGPAGAAWVFTRNGGVWSQQDKLVGTTDAYGGGLWSQGMSVALSADGNTAVVGGPSDNRTAGAVWVFTRSGGVWTQQGSKLVGTGAHLAGQPPLPLGQGMSVALSADGNSAIVGGWRSEAAWVFTRSGGVWTQQGNKLVGSGAVGSARQGTSVALSADGNTAIVGGWSDNNKAGAAWVFVRIGDVWAQQGKKLVGADAVGNARQGTSVALSADGNTAIVGGPGDSPWDRSVPFGLGSAGAAWVFTRIGGVWTQQGNKLVGSGTLGGGANQGTSVALSADGNIAVVGGFADDGSVVGWRASVFTRSDGHWKQETNLVGANVVGKSAPTVALSDDGNTIIVGGANDNGGVGAAWVFTRSGGHWTQDKYLVDTEAMKTSAPSVAAKGGNTMSGESNASGDVGAALVLTISDRDGGSTHQEPPPSASSNPALNWEE